MKRLTPRFRAWLAHRQRYVQRYHRRTAVQKSLEAPPVTSTLPLPKFYSPGPGTLALHAPENLSFSENHEEVVGFLEAVRDLRMYAAMTHRNRIEVDFTTIRSVGPAAALCLVAELDRWRHIGGRGLRAVKLEGWQPEVRRLLAEMGFFEVLQVDLPPEFGAASEAGRWIRFRTGTNNAGNIAQELRVEFESMGDVFPYRQVMFEALSEAIANAVEHGYPNDSPKSILVDRLGKRWWLSGSVDRNAGRIKVLFYDQGMTIPQMLPRKTFWEKVRGIMATRGVLEDDGNMIAAAMEFRRSGTGEGFRGRGMANLQRLADQSAQSRLRIISRKGYYCYSRNQPEQIVNCPFKLRGTLIEWDLPLA